MDQFLQCFMARLRDGIFDIITNLGIFLGVIFAIFTAAFIACVVAALVASGGVGVPACVEAYLTAVLALVGVGLIIFLVALGILIIWLLVDCAADSLLGGLGATADISTALPRSDPLMTCKVARALFDEASDRLA